MAKVSLRAYNREIETMIDRGQLDEAIAHGHHILKIFPKHLDTYRLLGKAYLESKRHGDAADIFLRILASVPNDFVAQVGMSIIRDEENKLDDAIWHMERAFETQPSNPAIQSELQRLYGRRDGVQPPRIRMTRGALAHMYVQGELYPQAISEISSVLKDDPGRADMQALLARACFKSGQKNEAADVASALLRRYPYSLDGNRVLAEILGAERPENAQLYRQRVVELDPYAAQVTGTMFQSNEVPEAAVSIERLDWNGQPVPMQPEWGESRAIGIESGTERAVEPDWLRGPFGEANPPARFDDAQRGPSQPTPASIFESTTPPAQPADEIPDFLRAAGWEESTGAFDESKSVFAEEGSTTGAQPIEQGDLPDWVKAMKPQETEPAAQGQEEELPDWINNIGKGALPSQPSEQVDWLGQPEQTTPASEGEQPDWLKSFASETESVSSTTPSEESDWLKGLGAESDFTPQPAQTETPDWLKDLGSEPATTPSEEAEQPDWLQQLGSETEIPGVEPAPTNFDFLNQLSEEPVLNASESTTPTVDVDKLGVSEQERDDSFAWLENLAAKQGATEGLLTKPEERREEEPEWVKQAKDFGAQQPPTSVTPEPEPEPEPEQPTKVDEVEEWLQDLEGQKPAEAESAADETAMWLRKLDEEEPAQPVTSPSANLDELGKSEEEQDDSFAWLENLAAKQGATEGLLTKPEERREEEPEWVKQAKDLSAQQPPTPVTPEPEPETSASMDDTGMWLRSLEAEERSSEPTADETSMWLRGLEEEKPTQPEPAADDTASWLKSLEEEKLPPTEPAADETAMWLKSLEQEESTPAQPEETTEGLPEWLQNIGEEEAPVAEETVSQQEPQMESEWKATTEEIVITEESKPEEEEGIPSWLSELDKEEERPMSVSADEDLPAWLRAEETAPEATEPTRPSDWHPIEEKQEEKEPEIIYSPPLEEPQKPEIIYSPPLEETREPEPIAQEESVELPEELQVEPQKEEPQPEPLQPRQPTPEPYLEPVPSRVPGVMVPSVDPVLGLARNELSRNNLSGALDSYAKLIKKGRFLDEVIYDLRDALYRYPVDVNVWQSLGDAYMRANRLQDALDAYTKAEELLR